jgi:hypothetical protein
MKYIFFVTAFDPIYDRILPLIEEKKDKGEIIVVVTTDQIEQFFREFTDLKIIRTKLHPDLITRKTKHKILIYILRSKVEFNTLFKDVKDSEIYFFGNSCAIVTFSYIKKLMKHNKVIQSRSPPEKGLFDFPVEHGLRAYVMRWIAKWLMGVDTIICHNRGVPFWQLDDKFYKNVEIIEGYVDEKKTINKYLPKLKLLKNKTILLVMQDLLESGCNFAEPNSFIAAVDKLMDILNNTFPNAYVIKPHPRENTLYGKMAQSKDVIPPYIPSEFLMHHPWKFVIGLFSLSLTSALDLTDATVISLVNLFEWKEFYVLDRWKQEMRDTQILLPNDFNELKNLLEGKANSHSTRSNH